MTKELDNTKETFYAARSGKNIFTSFSINKRRGISSKRFFYAASPLEACIFKR